LRLLLDTHAFLWWLDGDRRLPLRLRRLIGDDDNTIYVSAATAWEIATKARLGKVPGALDVAADIGGAVASQGFIAMAVTIPHAQRAGTLPGLHKDPFDRMLIAQSQMEDLPLVSVEEVFDGYGVTRVWA
jgi:PIN domain nuclease of toxin-antitoxin system